MRAHLIGQLTPDSSPSTLQFCGPVSCGFPSPAVDYQEPDLSLDKLVGIGPTSSIFLFRAFGDSMIGAGIHDGDVIAVDKAQQAQPGKVVLAVVGPEFLVKRLQYDTDGRALLCADNPRYPPLRLGEGEQLEVWGVCRWSLHELD
ncbi:LexA family protein [Pseudomonas aeruginosa]|jgi:DNA polymerase V